MRTWKEKSLSALLSAVMVLSLIPTASIPARAAVAVEKPDIDVSDTGKYFDAGIGTGASQALFVNGAFGDNPAIGAYNGSLTGNDKTVDVSTYNMMNCFGMYRNGTEVSAQVAGFTHPSNNNLSINWGTGQYCDTLNVCTYNDKGGKSGSLTVTIADNPTLKTLASSGGLQVYFNGYACAGKEARKAWPDDHTYVTGNLSITNATPVGNAKVTNGSGKAKAQKKAFGTGGWVTLSENSVITISWSVDRSAGKFSNGWADKDVGIGDSVMLFRKVACPNIADYILTANGDYSTSGSRGAEVLLGNDGSIQLDLNVTLAGNTDQRDVVVSSLGGTKIPYSDDYNLLVQLGKRVLFNNTEGTGYDHQGEPVYMKLTSAKVLNNGGIVNKNIEDNDEERLKVLQGGISSLHYEWNASKGDYYGNNPIPGDGDWAGLVSSSNSLNLIDSIVLASFHDLAGNPLMLGGNLVPYEKSGTAYTTNLLYEKADTYEAGKTYYKNGDVYQLVTSDPGTLDANYYNRRNVLTGTVKLNNTTLTGVGNPFAAGNSSDAGCGFVINAVTPTYSRSTNAVQPDVLTQLTLNHGDSFDIALNFSEIVKLREFKPGSGNSTTATGYAPENLYLELNNGLRARYKSGMGTKQLIFTVSVPDMYTLTVAEPLTWATDYTKYYTRSGTGTAESPYVYTLNNNQTWAANTYYSKVDDVTGSGNYLEINRMFVEDATTHAAAELTGVGTAHYKTYNGVTGNTDTYSTASDYVLTDYVGNPVCEPIGQKEVNSYDTTMAWAKLQVDNTKPQISIETTDDGKYKVNVTEDGSGVFHVANATQGSGASNGVAYYVWVKNDDAQEVCNAFIDNNFEKVKRYSLAPSSADKVTVNGTTYGLTSCIPGTNGTSGTIIEKPKGAGDWCLLAFTADMTWDSARQLIQYGKANYKTNPTGYLTTLGEKLGVQFDEMFEQVATQPENWATTYHNYYIKNDDGTFSNISKGVEYPAWKAGVYYERKYTALEAEPDGWDPYQVADNGTWKKLSDGRYLPIATGDNVTTKYKYDDSGAYTKYYTKTTKGDYVPVKPISGVPEWKEGTYYGYAEVTPTNEITDQQLSNYYVRDTDANGGAKYTKASEKYVPDFAPNGVYSSSDQQNYTLVASEPEDWKANYSNYYYGVTEYKLYDEWKTTATVEGGPYYTKGEDEQNPQYTQVTENADKWTTYAADTFYVENANNPGTYSLATVVPKFEEGKSYSRVEYKPISEDRVGTTDTFKAYDEYGTAIMDGENQVTVTFDDIYEDLYRLENGVYTKNVRENDSPVAYDGTSEYYRIVYAEAAVSTKPDDWTTNYKNYATRTVDYQQVTAAYPRDVKYYDRYDNENKEKLNALSNKPADWNTAYYYYSTSPDKYSPVQWVSAPEFTAGKYYTYGFATLAAEPANWPEVYTQYCYNAGTDSEPNYVKVDIASEAQKTALAAKEVSILSAAPSFSSFDGRVYKAKADDGFFVKTLANKISDDTRKAAFTKDMLAASTDAAKIEVIRRYSAFVDDVYAADVAFMASAGGYANWTGNDYSSSDSNWAEPATSGSVDLLAPTVEFETVTGNGSEKVTVGVKVEDNKAVSTVKYQFVAAKDAGSITVGSDTANWTVGSVSFSAITTGDEENKTGGDYVLCVYAEDTAGNKTLKKQPVTVNKVESVQYSLTEPAGAKPYKEFAGVSATFYGTVYGDDIFKDARQFTVYAVIDDNATKEAAGDWGNAIEGTAAADVTKDGVTYTARSYAMPEIKGVTGYYYLHIKYTYTSNGTTKSEVVNKPYWLEDNKAQIAINQTGSDEDGITVEITASGASSIQYALTEINATKPGESSGAWKTYSNTDKVVISKTDDAFKNKTAVRVWARVNGENSTARSADFLLSGGSMATGILANPDVELLDVVTENGKRYAIVRFNKLGEDPKTSALSVGAEYSVAVAAPNAATDSYVWQRWMPLDNMVKVKLGSGDARLIFKFRNGDAATTSNYPTLDVAATAAETDNAWTVATRSTLRVVSGDTGVTLTLQSSDQETDTIPAHANGVYKGSNGFQAVVSNINNNPPSYSLVWSDGGEHTGENGVMATSVSVRLASDEDITVKSLTFDGAAVAPSRTYLFKQNGTAVFTFVNEAGVEATATAKVTWLDTKMVLTVTESYDNYKKYEYETGKCIANGARLTVATNNKQLASLAINGTDVTDEMGLDITRNGTYQVSATSVSGQLVTQKIIVRDIVSSVTAPKQTDDTVTINGNGEAVVTIKGTASANNPVRDGRKTIENPSASDYLTPDENGVYTITKRYTNNGTYTEYVTDSVGNVASYQVKVSVFDTTAPVIKLNNGNKAITKPQTASAMTDEQVKAWVKGELTITDDKTEKEKINVELEGTVNTASVGAYSVLVKATDEKKNQSMLRVTVYVLPNDGSMLVTDHNDVLFCSQSKDAALVTRNEEKQVVLTVKDYDWVELKPANSGATEKFQNKAATLSVTVKQGAFREGQMKYFDTVATGKITYNKDDRTATITLDVKDLPGTGWYTVLIRNSEREREFTTFFINADN